jgi:hypothetical protein
MKAKRRAKTHAPKPKKRSAKKLKNVEPREKKPSVMVADESHLLPKRKGKCPQCRKRRKRCKCAAGAPAAVAKKSSKPDWEALSAEVQAMLKGFFADTVKAAQREYDNRKWSEVKRLAVERFGAQYARMPIIDITKEEHVELRS